MSLVRELTPSLVKTFRKVVDHGGVAEVSRRAVLEAVSRIVAAGSNSGRTHPGPCGINAF
jgi:hypothetical protein